MKKIKVSYSRVHIPTGENSIEVQTFNSYEDAFKTICQWNNTCPVKWQYIIMSSEVIYI